MSSINEAHIKAARKRHQCSWCAEAIEVGQPYFRYRWTDCVDIGTGKMHPECKLAAEQLGDFEAGCGDFTRGCTCAAGGHDDAAYRAGCTPRA